MKAGGPGQTVAGFAGLVWCALAAGAALADGRGYDLPRMRADLSAVAEATRFDAPPPMFAEKSEHVCDGLDLIDPGTRKRASFDADRAQRAASAAGAPPTTPLRTVRDPSSCTARLEYADSAFLIDMVAYKARLAPTPEQAALRARRAVRKNFPIANWDRRELISPDGATYATLIGDDFGTRSTVSDKPVRATTDGAADAAYHFACDIWEACGDVWSPDSRRVVARRHDARALKGVALTDHLGASETVTRFTYWGRAGEPLPIDSLIIHEPGTGATIPVGVAGDAGHYLFFLDWRPDGRALAVMRIRRDLSVYELHEADAATGKARLLFTETAANAAVKWPGPPATFTWLPSGQGFIWRSNAEGHAQYYLHDEPGRRLRRLTSGTYDVEEIVAIDEARDRLYFMAGSDPERPFDAQLHVASLEGGAARRLTPEPGQHAITLSPGKDHFIDEHHDVDRAPVRALRRTRDGTVIMKLADAVTPDTGRPPPEEFTALAADGVTTVHGVILKPRDFDPARRYPVIERIYGAMQSTAAPRGWGGFGRSDDYTTMLQVLADAGFVIIISDTPGTPGRGREYVMRLHRRWPDGLIADHVSVLKSAAASRPWMDMSRVGIEGNSWGGYSALLAGLEAPDVYRAVSASVPQTDFLDHAHWIEFQLGEVSANPEAYARGALSPRIGQLEPPVLLLAGTADVNVPVSNTMKVLDAMADAGKPYELVLFPGTNHAHQGRGDRYAYAVSAIVNFFKRTLGDPQ